MVVNSKAPQAMYMAWNVYWAEFSGHLIVLEIEKVKTLKWVLNGLGASRRTWKDNKNSIQNTLKLPLIYLRELFNKLICFI